MNGLLNTANGLLTTKQVAEQCGVTERTVQLNAQKIGKVAEHGKAMLWTEDDVKRLQVALVKNQMAQGSGAEIVKQNSETAFAVGISLQVLIKSGNIAALNEFFDICKNAALAEKRNKELAAEKEKLKIELDDSKEWYSLKRLAVLNGYGLFDTKNKTWHNSEDDVLDWRLFKKKSVDMGVMTKQAFDANFGTVRLYHISVCKAVYPELTYMEEKDVFVQ